MPVNCSLSLWSAQASFLDYSEIARIQSYHFHNGDLYEVHACKRPSLRSTPATYRIPDYSYIGRVQQQIFIFQWFIWKDKLHACKTAYIDYMYTDVGCPKNTIKLNHSLTHMPVKFSFYGQLHPLTLFRMIATSGTSKQVTLITGFSNTVNAQAGHFHYRVLLEISSNIPPKCYVSHIRSLIWVWTIVVLGTLHWLMRKCKLYACKLFSRVSTLFTHLILGYYIICAETILVTIY